MPHVFISYSTNNKMIAEELCAVLERNGLKCWIAPRDIPPGVPWAGSIVTALSESQLMIVIFSAEANRSEQMARELASADNNKVPILPIRLDGTPLTGQFAYFLTNQQWLDLRDHPNGSESAIVDAVRKLQARSSSGDCVQPGLAPPLRETPVRPARRSETVPAVHAVAGELRDVLRTLVAVVTKRERALADFNLSDPRTLFFAFRILIYVSVAGAMLHIPTWSAKGVRFTHPAFLASVVAEELVEQIAFCLLLYAAFKLFGGTMDPQAFVCAFCLLSAYLLMSELCLLPVQTMAIDVQNTDLGKFIEGAAGIVDRVSIATLAVYGVASTARIALMLCFLVSLCRAFRITDQLGVARTAISLVCGTGMWFVSVLVFSQAFEANLYTAFRAR